MPDPVERPDLSAVPLFPLPNVVLFPQAVLPLHIFEERFKTMIADALGGQRQIAMALLGGGWELNYHGRPSIDPVVCVGTILIHEKLADGRYNILLQGHTRARVVREFKDKPYRVAELAPLAESPASESELAGQRQRLIEILDDPRLLATGIGRKFRQLLDSPIPTAQVADLIAFNFLDDVSVKQSLLSDGDVHRRVARLLDAFLSFHAALPSVSPVSSCAHPSLN